MPSDTLRRAEELFHAARELEDEARSELLKRRCGGDPQLRAEVESLLRAAAARPEFLEQGPLPAGAPAGKGDAVLDAGLDAGLDDTPPPERIGPYRIFGELGRGGMGTVYRAEQEGVGRTVALKLLHPALATELFQRRFRAEQRILAALEHPGIARLYDAGTSDGGVPYLAMELVEGENLVDWCERRVLPLAARLRLFDRICRAVQYAHEHLVVHRDLKPSNLFVTADGEPKLLDFGIAKLIEPEATDRPAATATLLRLMTPEYASPEQRRGEQVTTASDVYSLGVILHELLTGSRPLSSGEASTADGRPTAEPAIERPSSAVRRSTGRPGQRTPLGPAERRRRSRALRGDLDTIVLKALADDPRRRYTTAAELGDDLCRHLDGRPIRARPASLGDRAARFARRHVWGVAASATAVALLVGALAVALRQADAARANSREAGQQRELAERRFREVRELANTFLFDFHDAIADLPGATAARELVLRRGVEFLERLEADAADDPELSDELARSSLRLAVLQGATIYSSHVASEGGPAASLARAIRLAEENVTRHPEEARYARTLSSALLALGRFHQKRWEAAPAAAAFERSLAIARHALARAPGDPAAREGAIEAHLAWGVYLHMHAPLERAEAEYRTALDLARSPLPAWRSSASAAGAEEECTNWLKWLLAHAERWNEALVFAEREHALAFDRLAATPESADSRRSAALAEHNVGWVLLGAGRPAEALTRLDGALARQLELERADPGNRLRRLDLGRTLENRADALAALGHRAAALVDHERALAIHRELLAGDPENATLRARVAWNLRRSAEDALAAGRPAAESARRLERAVALYEQNLVLDPKTTFDRLNRARALAALAPLAADRDRRRALWSAALAAWRGLRADGVLPPSESEREADAERELARLSDPAGSRAVG